MVFFLFGEGIDLLEKLLSELISESEFLDKNAIKRFLAEKPDGLPMLLELLPKNFNVFGPSRFFVFSHSEVPLGVLAKNCRSLAWLERCAIARNPNTSTETLQILAKDGNRIVRAAARGNLGDRYQT